MSAVVQEKSRAAGHEQKDHAGEEHQTGFLPSVAKHICCLQY
jgi:hypothetical protein